MFFVLLGFSASGKQPTLPKRRNSHSNSQNNKKEIHIGTDSGATTSKTCGILEEGKPVTLQLAQSTTNASLGRQAVVDEWIKGIERFLAENNFSWDNIAGVGLAISGPYRGSGVPKILTPYNAPANNRREMAEWMTHPQNSLLSLACS